MMNTASPELSFKTALKRAAAAALLALAATAPAQTLQNLWELNPPDVEGNIDITGTQRGLTYNALSNQVIMSTRLNGNKAVLYNGDTGALEGYLNLTGVGGGSSVFTWNNVACADDGVLYGFNVSATTFKIYRWANTDTNNPPTVAYGPDDPGYGYIPSVNARWGDNVAIRGSGTSTEILISSYANTNVVLFTTTDGENFSPIRIDVAGINNNDVRDGLAFYTNNTFWAKRIGRPLILVRYTITSATTATGEVLGSYTSSLASLTSNPGAQLLGGITFTTPGQLQLLSTASLPPSLIAQTNFLTSNVNGNGTGAAVFAGEGRTNRLYALWSNNGIKAARIVWNAPPAAPVISEQPAGATIYTNLPAFSFVVSASGNPPPAYQWYYNGNPIAGATNSVYARPGPFSTADSGEYTVIVSNAAGSATSAPPAVLTVWEPQFTGILSSLWTITNGSRPYLQSDNNARGMAYDPVTGNLVLVSRTGGNAIYAISAATGADQFALNTLGITSGGGNGTFGLNMIGVSSDGAVYAGNLTINTGDGSFKLYRWNSVDPAAVPELAFDSDPSPGQNLRWGDSLAVRGAGVGTQVLIGSGTGSGGGGSPGQYVTLFTTTDGSTFTAQPLVAPAGTPNGFAQLGIAFGSGNTLWTKSSGQALRKFSFDPTFSDTTLTLLAQYNQPARLNPATGIAVDTSRALLAAVEVANPDNLQVYWLPASSDPPVLLDQEFFATDNANGNATASVAFGNDNTLYALDSNNGLLAVTLNVGAALPPLRLTDIIRTTTPAPGAIVTWQALVGGSYQLQFKGDLAHSTWLDIGAPVIANETKISVSDNGTGFTNRFYRVEQR